MTNQNNSNFMISTPLGDGILSLNRLYGDEGISEPFSFSLDLSSDDKQLDFSRLVGQKAVIKIRIADEISSHRYINGIIGEFNQSGTDGNQALYHAKIKPWVWLLSFSNDYKIYQNMSVVEIVESVFTEFTFCRYELRLQKSYNKREYCTQYGESHFNFVTRLLAEEGIFYFFSHTEKEHTMIISDDNSAFTDCQHLARVDYRAENNDAIANIVDSLAYKQQITTNEFATNDYDFKKANTDLSSSKVVTRDKDDAYRTRYEYPGNYAVKADGENLAEIRLEALEFGKKLISGTGNVKSFVPGYKFSLTRHFRQDLNTQFVVKSISHFGSPERYHNSFEAFSPKSVCRPQNVPPKPFIYGAQTAQVTGPAGEEIYTDEYGRIKVLFHWDKHNGKNEKSSVWLRVAQNWTGNGFGILTIPRIGCEVVVSFLGGDPDRPLVTGMVYNSMNQPPYNLPADQTVSGIKTNSSKGGRGFNEIRLEDKKDKEEIFVHAQKDYNIEVLNNLTTKVMNDEERTVYQNRTTTIENGDETLTVAKGNRAITVSEGDENIRIDKGCREVFVKSDQLTAIDGNRNTAIRKNDQLKVDESRTVQVKDSETHTNNADFKHIVRGKYELMIDGDLIINVKGDIKINSKSSIKTEAFQDIISKAKMAIKSEANLVETKAKASLKLDGGGVASVKAGIIKLG